MRRFLLAMLLAISATATLHAGVIRHDTPDSDYTDRAALPEFASVGELLWSDYVCSGVLISPRWVLTAAHCLDDSVDASEYTFTVGGSTYRGAAKVAHPDYDGSIFNPNDIGLILLDAPVANVTPAILNTNRNEVGHVGTNVGFGYTGTGLTGAIEGTSGTKRAGDNVIDILGSSVDDITGAPFFRSLTDDVLIQDFDRPGVPSESRFGSNIPLELEYLSSPGDSGGGLFIDFGSGHVLAGIFVEYYSMDGSLNSDYGDFTGSIRVSSHLDFIHSTIAIPEPSSLVLALLGTVAVIIARRPRIRTNQG